MQNIFFSHLTSDLKVVCSKLASWSQTSTSILCLCCRSRVRNIRRLDNRYGHPHKEVLDILNKVGAKILSTIDLGTIEFETNGMSLKLK